jgi:methylglutaconyl-CoA hydratase
LANNINHGGEDVICRTDGQTLRITLNRPDAGNRLTAAMFLRITDFLRSINGSATIKAVVMDANGPDFCLGGELGRYWEMEPEEIKRFADAFIDALLEIRNCAVPVVLSAAGRIWGGGVCLLDAADIVIIRDDAAVAIPEVLDGRPPVLSFIGAYRNIPEKTLMRIALSGEAINASEALRIGLVSAVAHGEAEQVVLCESWVQKAVDAGNNPSHIIKALRAAADCGQYERQLSAAGVLLVKALKNN